jgi:argininosuccinate lyase
MQGKEVHDLSDSELQGINPHLTTELRSLLSGLGATSSRTSVSGTSTASVKTQIAQLDKEKTKTVQWISSARENFSRMMSI